MKRFSAPTFPPSGPWDSRLSEAACNELLPTETLHQNAWFSVRRRGGYFTIEYLQPQVVVLPVIDAASIVMVRVRRPVICDCPLELPAGGGEEGEPPEAIAARELAEETGISIADRSRFQPLAPLAGSSTRMPKLSYVFRVDLTREEYLRRGAHDREIECVEDVPLAEAARRIVSGEIYVAVPVAVIGRFLAECRYQSSRWG